MNETEMAGALRDTFWVIVKIGGPLLVATLIIGLVVSLFQAVTQINESTLVFLPKLLTLFACMALLGPFMISTLDAYTQALFGRLVAVGGQ